MVPFPSSSPRILRPLHNMSRPKEPRVRIEPGCIVCRACEQICPEVFEVTEETSLVRPDADFSEPERVQEAAAACPVEVIRVAAPGSR